jgi:hypothetical protein
MSSFLSPAIPLVIWEANFGSELKEPAVALHVPLAAVPRRGYAGWWREAIDSPAQTAATSVCGLPQPNPPCFNSFYLSVRVSIFLSRPPISPSHNC